MFKRIFVASIILFSFPSKSLKAQKTAHFSSADIKSRIEKLNVLGSVLYFAAHPDDENTKLIAWLAQEKHYRTGYLSLTRGDGGQNLIGTEQGIELGLIRTQELLAARNIDQGEQFFSSAYDFGFSKTPEETFNFWDKAQILKEAVWIIRKFQPDLIITRFPADERGGHGHHQASAMLAEEAFYAAADPTKYPEQLQELKPWKTTRLLWNTFNFGNQDNTNEDQLQINIGDYNKLLGQSYGEISAASRSAHKSQGFGTAAQVGRSIEYFEHIAGVPAKSALMDDVIADWSRIKDVQPIQDLIRDIALTYHIDHPEKSIPKLIEALDLIEKIKDAYWKEQKTEEIKQLILACAGIRLESLAEQPSYAVGENITINNQIILRAQDISVEVLAINNKQVNKKISFNALNSFPSQYITNKISQPYWLNQEKSIGKFNYANFQDTGYPENPDAAQVSFEIMILGKKLSYQTKIRYKYTDPVFGELYRPLTITPKITAITSQDLLITQKGIPQKIQLTFKNHSQNKNLKETIKPIFNAQWKVTPEQIDLTFSENENLLQKEISITSQTADTQVEHIYLETTKAERIKINRELTYQHIPTINWFPDLFIKTTNLALQIDVKKIGYLVGAADLIPESLQAIGLQVDILQEAQLLSVDLKQYDAIVVGIRAFNVIKSMDQISPKLLDYVAAGGTLVEQYNVNSKLMSNKFGPYAFSLGRSRVTEENSVVQFDAKNPVFNYPNKISAADFEGWQQERGLYFAEQIDSQYQTPISIHDKNEAPHQGSLLIAHYGTGKFVYTSLSFFRQLPAGVPGAYRLFVNLLSKSK